MVAAGKASKSPSQSLSVAIITPYRAQLATLRREFAPLLPRPAVGAAPFSRVASLAAATTVLEGGVALTVEFSTVDGFQVRWEGLILGGRLVDER
jgi:hypothetical protein